MGNIVIDKPYEIISGDRVLKEGKTFDEAERFIHEGMDEAATASDWDAYSALQHDYITLEENYRTI